MLVPILRTLAESFAADSTDESGADAVVNANEKGGEALWAGSQVGPVTVFQTNSRIVFAGGVQLFSDKYARKELLSGMPSGNSQFRDVAAVEHHRVNETQTPYSSIDDLQLEFSMVDPHIRTSLLHVPGSPGTYQVQFRAPDRHGCVLIRLDLEEEGVSLYFFSTSQTNRFYSYFSSSMTVPVMPPRHDKYPRFLSVAWPYYTGAISTSVGFFLFEEGIQSTVNTYRRPVMEQAKYTEPIAD
ncbi:Oligosaccharyltransferase 48 kDa subunit beta-domain-containing protein, partial [Suillus paluster]|uniref:Oligosaccharyltransferase 48 kDa subunit beta-domain-containing protein n=1 Tax=Suillus paluster TaxID=48578 RepID=UPI001B885D49